MLAASEANWTTKGALDSALAADLLVVQNLSGPEPAAVVRLRQAVGRTTLFEIADDPLTPRPWMGITKGPDPASIRRVMQIVSCSAGMQFSSDGLMARYGKWKSPNRLLPNIVNLSEDVPPRVEGGLVIGWAGTRSHRGDLAEIAPALIDLCRRWSGVRIAIKGDPTLRAPFDSLPSDRIYHEDFGTYHDYVAFLRRLDIGIIPLGQSRFDLGRTDVKAVEMAAAGAVALVQDAPTYAGLPNCFPRFADAADLLALIEALSADPERRVSLAKEAGAWVRAERSPELIVTTHLDWYLSWLDEMATPLPRLEADTEFEARFLAVRRRQVLGEPDVLDAARELLAERPEHEQTRWMLGCALCDSGYVLEGDRTLVPLAAHPVYRDLMRIRASKLPRANSN